MTELDISCLPKDLPEFIEVDLSELDAGHSIHVSALKLPAGVTVVTRGRNDPVVATAVVPRAAVETEEETAAAAEAAAAPVAAAADKKDDKGGDKKDDKGGRQEGRQEEVVGARGLSASKARARHAGLFRCTGVPLTVMPTPIRLVVGLGNPGREYATHAPQRRLLVRRRARAHAIALRSRTSRSSAAETSPRRATCAPQAVDLHEPVAAARWRRSRGFFAIAPDAILVVHDELDLRPGEAKLKLGGGHAGHNGLRDIHAQLGTPDFWRLRIGIGHPRDSELSQQQVVDYVLQAAARGRHGGDRGGDRARARRLARHRGAATWSAR